MLLTKDQIRQVFALRDDGVSQSEIARRLQIGRGAVRRHINKSPHPKKTFHPARPFCPICGNLLRRGTCALCGTTFKPEGSA